MADYTAQIAPFINVVFYVTAEFGQYPSGGVHNGLDIATPGSGSNLYSIVNGKIIGKGYDGTGLGNYIIMKDDISQNAFLYGHMREASPLNIGDRVQTGTYVGHEGQTGNATGIHLHLMGEYLGASDTWVFGLPISDLLNPATILGIPNQVGISAIYNGVPIPPIQVKKKKFPWAIYTNIIRKRTF